MLVRFRSQALEPQDRDRKSLLASFASILKARKDFERLDVCEKRVDVEVEEAKETSGSLLRRCNAKAGL